MGYTISMEKGEMVITDDNGGWERRDRYTGELIDYSIEPDFTAGEVGYVEYVRRVHMLAKDEAMIAAQADKEQKGK